MGEIVLSIIIPVYNTARYLKRCLNSVLVNLDEQLEIIIVDDGSNDGSNKICDEYAKQYKEIKTIHKVNGGLSSARNAGLKEAKGRYISFLDSDDLLAPSFWPDLKKWIRCEWDILNYKYCFEKEENIFHPQGTKKVTIYTISEYIDRFIKNEYSNQIVADFMSCHQTALMSCL